MKTREKHFARVKTSESVYHRVRSFVMYRGNKLLPTRAHVLVVNLCVCYTRTLSPMHIIIDINLSEQRDGKQNCIAIEAEVGFRVP